MNFTWRDHLTVHEIPLAQDLAIAGDVFHDFEATGGFRENIGVEIRLAKFFFPQPRSK